MKILEYFWDRPMYLPYIHENLSDEKLNKFEGKIGYKLPKSLARLLKIQNGGYIRYGLPQTPPMQVWGVGERYPNLTLIADEFLSQDIDYLDFSLEGLLAFDGDGHYYFCLDYRQNKQNPQVSYIDIQSGQQGIVAENFDEFLEKLELKTDGFYVIESEKSLVEIVEIFKNKLIIKFNEPNDFDFGYMQYRGKYGGHWLCLSPNEVPLAFARKGEENFHLLKNYEGKMAIRFPEINSKYTLLNLYNEELAPTLIKEFNSGFKIEKLSNFLRR